MLQAETNEVAMWRGKWAQESTRTDGIKRECLQVGEPQRVSMGEGMDAKFSHNCLTHRSSQNVRSMLSLYSKSIWQSLVSGTTFYNGAKRLFWIWKQELQVGRELPFQAWKLKWVSIIDKNLRGFALLVQSCQRDKGPEMLQRASATGEAKARFFWKILFSN
jgi:hypothetical protein